MSIQREKNGAGMKIVTKTLRSEYDKGVILPNGRVKPIYLEEDEPTE